MPKKLLNDNRLWNAVGTFLGKERFVRVVKDQARIDRLLFVCTGNICRSPYAEVWSRTKLSFPQALASRGLFTTPGKGADNTAIRVASGSEVDLSLHRTTSFDPSEITAGDLILVMDRGHYNEVISRAPQLKRQITLLGAFDPRSELIISDPWGKDDTTFRSCFSQIERNLIALEKLINGA